jgi:hypothetical protein
MGVPGFANTEPSERTSIAKVIFMIFIAFNVDH